MGDVDDHPHELLVGEILLQLGDETGVQLDVVGFELETG